MKKYEYHVIVIGAGSGGLVVASGAAALGAKVALVERDRMGGDCLNTGCVPSKSFLRGAHQAKEIQNAIRYGLHAHMDKVDMVALMNRVHAVISEIAPHDSEERYRGLGVDVFHGKGILENAHTVRVADKELTASSIVIATGSVPHVPAIPGLESIPYLTNNNIFDLEKQPKHLIVFGGGPVGLELGQGFRHLGSQVTVVDRNNHLFGKDDAEVGPLMEQVFMDDGMTLMLGTTIGRVEKKGDDIHVFVEKEGMEKALIGDAVLVSLGRTPDTAGMGLEEAGVILTKHGYVQVNEKLQSSVKNIYACGDAAGPFQFTHMAGYQAGVVIRNMIFHLGRKVSDAFVPWTTYTKPEVAHVGHTEDVARKKGLFEKTILVSLKETDRAKTDNDVTGFLKVVLGKGGRLIGATLVGDKAGEMIPIASLAIRNKMKLSDLLGIIYAYPTEAEIFQRAALQHLRDGFKPWQGKLVKRLFL